MWFVRLAPLLLVVSVAIVLLRHPVTPPPTTTAAALPGPAAPGVAGYVGEAICARCHETEQQLWSSSHHALAMQPANAQTVLGDFDDAQVTSGEVKSRFFTRDDRYFVHTLGPDGCYSDFEISYCFGIEPLQQYLVAFPGGRLQALNLCWDTRSQEMGGQRWFDLDADGQVAVDDPLHWTSRNQNWNFMCAECHSTDLQKNYDVESDTYQTTWSRINVSCEACHGPGSDHVRWAEAVDAGGPLDADMGLSVRLKVRDGGYWTIDDRTGKPVRSTPLATQAEIETCARCHSRRVPIEASYVHGQPLADSHRVALLDEGLYHGDGQILDEVYVYGSFLQSTMYHAGVRCSDCHQPHSAKLKAPAGQVCFSCHLPDRYDTPLHHFHQIGSEGSSCISCHMPSRLYMVIDERHDHSFRVPRPDLALRYGTPDACVRCHDDMEPKKLVEVFERQYGSRLQSHEHFVEAIDAGRRGRPGAEQALCTLLSDGSQSAIVRATGARLLHRYATTQSSKTLQAHLVDTSPLVRAEAVSGLSMLPVKLRVAQLIPMLEDPVRAVRLEAQRLLARIPPAQLDPQQQAMQSKAMAAYVNSQMVNAERPGAHLALGLMYQSRGQPDLAEAEYLKAIRLDDRTIEARINLADLYRTLGRESDVEQVLRKAIAVDSHRADAHHALGLALIRQKRIEQAIKSLATAYRLDSEPPRYGYAYALALQGTGRVELAIDVLRAVDQNHPYDREVLLALVTFSRDEGRLDEAIGYASRFLEIEPERPDIMRLLQELKAAAKESSD